MIRWCVKNFKNLSLDELYGVLRLRQEVFIIEQQCNYLDADGHDLVSQHVLGYKDHQLIAYMRVVNAGCISKNVIFGRILVKSDYRKKGLGDQLLVRAINLFEANETIEMSAQLYLENFYKKHGFKSVGIQYLEDNIPHIKMIKNG